jgi:hypothetical protein
VSDLDADYIACGERGEIFSHAILLNSAAGKVCDRHAAFLFDPDYAEAHGLADARYYGYVLLHLAGARINAFLARKYARNTAKVEVEIHLGVAEKCGLFEHCAGYHCAFKPRKRGGEISVFGCMYK